MTRKDTKGLPSDNWIAKEDLKDLKKLCEEKPKDKNNI